MMATNNFLKESKEMTLVWKRCAVCGGHGKVTLIKTRISILKLKELTPLIPDENTECPNCKGRGQIYTKNYLPNPWIPWKEENPDGKN